MEVKSNHTWELFLVFPRGVGSSGQCHILSSSPYPTGLFHSHKSLGRERLEREPTARQQFLIKHINQFSSVTQSCPALCDPMDCSTAGLPVHHQLMELTQTHVHLVGDAIQPSHPLSSSSPAFNLSQHQGLFKMSQLFAAGGQNIGVSASTSAFPMNTQD